MWSPGCVLLPDGNIKISGPYKRLRRMRLREPSEVLSNGDVMVLTEVQTFEGETREGDVGHDKQEMVEHS